MNEGKKFSLVLLSCSRLRPSLSHAYGARPDRLLLSAPSFVSVCLRDATPFVRDYCYFRGLRDYQISERALSLPPSLPYAYVF